MLPQHTERRRAMPMIAHHTLTYRVDASPDLFPLLREIKAKLDSPDESLKNLIKLPPEPADFLSIDVDSALALRTGECRVAIKPSPKLLDLISAVRAGHGNPHVTERTNHNNPLNGEDL